MPTQVERIAVALSLGREGGGGADGDIGIENGGIGGFGTEGGGQGGLDVSGARISVGAAADKVVGAAPTV